MLGVDRNQHQGTTLTLQHESNVHSDPVYFRFLHLDKGTHNWADLGRASCTIRGLDQLCTSRTEWSRSPQSGKDHAWGGHVCKIT